MTRLFARLAVRHKLVFIIMVTTTIVLTLASVGYVAGDYWRTRTDLALDMESQAELILGATQVAVDFGDEDFATAILRSLAPNRHLRASCLYDGKGQLFALYQRQDSQGCAPVAPADGLVYTRDRVQLTRTSSAEGKRAATLSMRSDLQVLTDRLRQQAIIAFGLLLFALGIALLLSARLQRVVSQPLASLSQTAADVSARGDYSVRARRTTNDELGALVDAFNRMLERIQSRETELSRTNEELRKANRLKDEFLATLSHELRTPLNAIIGWTRLLRAHAVPAERLDTALEKIERNAQVQTRLVEDLLEVSRITTGKLRLELRPVDLVAIANTAIDSINPAAETRGVSIQRRYAEPMLPTLGDPDRLQQVIWNLLSNAVKFTPSGGRVTMQLRRVGDMDEITVSDTGIGIDPSFLDNVFDTFRQADASSTRAHGGLGLGLSIVKRLVELHGGEVEARSEGKGQGATFRVSLPVRVPAYHDGVAPVPLVAHGRLAGTSVLVVDDDRDTRELLESVLNTAGATVHTASSAQEGLASALELQPDVLLSDIAMPGQDGYHLLGQLDAALGRSIPRVRIALSAFASQADRERSIAAGFDDHLAKPFDPVALVELLERKVEPASASQNRPSRQRRHDDR
jgi:signal transduction histidine kinase/ActR/RegA family two-component response regulator